MFAKDVYLETAGVRFPEDPAVLTPAIRAAILADRFETEEAAALAPLLVPGDRVLDIGAGTGFTSTLLARDPRVARVVAVEANPALIDYIGRLHRQNGVHGVRVVNAVLGAAAEGERLFYQRRDFWMGSLSPEPNAYEATVAVPCRRLDDLLAEEAISVIVCDIEGGEVALFEEAQLDGVDRIHLELHDHITGLDGIRRLFATLAARGFAYDPRHSERAVVLFRRVDPAAPLRPYAG